jgi:DNA-directed RNA polymerase sigma subunit (sigma70/sigma32)
MMQIPELGPQELDEAIHAMAKGDAWAARLVEERFLPKVVRWVLPYRGKGLELGELIEIGNRALLKGLRQWKAEAVVDATDYLENCVAQDVEAALFTRS